MIVVAMLIQWIISTIWKFTHD